MPVRKRKKARPGISLALELAISFVSAGDLQNLASVNRDSMKLARWSYLSRIRTPLVKKQKEGNSITNNNTVPLTTSVLFLEPTNGYATFRANLDQWWSCKRKKNGLFTPLCKRIIFRRNGSWTILASLPRTFCGVEKVLQKWQFCLPQKFQSQLQGEVLYIRHCSLINNMLVAVLSKTTTTSTDLDMMEAEVQINPNSPFTRKQLFVVVYNLSDTIPFATGHRIDPVLSQALGPPVDRIIYGNLENCNYGDCSRSADGRVLAVATALPGEDHEAGGFFRPDAEITIFDLELKFTRLSKRLSLSVPCGGDYDSGGISSALSNMGDIISVTAAFSDAIGFFWGAFDITGASAKSTFGVDHMPATTTMMEQRYSPDNELIMRFADPDKKNLQKVIAGTKFPFFATRIVLLVEEFCE